MIPLRVWRTRTFEASHFRGRTAGPLLHKRRRRGPKEARWGADVQSGQPPAAMESKNSLLVAVRRMRPIRNSIASVDVMSEMKFRRR